MGKVSESHRDVLTFGPRVCWHLTLRKKQRYQQIYEASLTVRFLIYLAQYCLQCLTVGSDSIYLRTCSWRWYELNMRISNFKACVLSLNYSPSSFSSNDKAIHTTLNLSNKQLRKTFWDIFAPSYPLEHFHSWYFSQLSIALFLAQHLLICKPSLIGHVPKQSRMLANLLL